MKKIRYGIIGFGAFAERAIMPAIRSTNNSELVAIQKRSLDMANWKAQEHGIPLFFDTVEALVASPEVDAVFIVSANAQHYSETLAAAAAKKHVLVEKPMAVSYSQALAMTDACRTAGVQLMVGHMLRFSPLVRRMKEIVQSGIIGEITYAQSHFIYDVRLSQRKWVLDRNEAGGGPLFDIAIHCLDSLRFVLNDDRVTAVQSLMKPERTSGKVEMTNVLSLQFSLGTLATIYSSYETPYRQGFIEFFGTNGSISAFHFTPSNTDTELEIKFGVNGRIDRIEKEQIRVPDLYALEVAHFSDCLLRNEEPCVTMDHSLHNQEILERAVRI
ncbi:MAG: Gfo/Idh/MocA family oxidoreductase [Bacteriovoracaceae bacterium]|nr:Gfo/Idh/MocA family oxidoreductase [Bacteroidota bacterium]